MGDFEKEECCKRSDNADNHVVADSLLPDDT